MDNIEQIAEQLEAWLIERLAGKPAVIGISGGIDSAVVAYAVAKAIGKASVHTLILPNTHTAASDITDAQLVAEATSEDSRLISIAQICEDYAAVLPEFDASDVARINLQPRVRMSLLYGLANSLGGLVIGTGNRTELEVGYFTKYGDGGVDLLPLGAMYKKDVRALAKHYGVPQSVIDKAPSANLFAGQTDENELGMSYPVLDAALAYIDSDADTLPEGVEMNDIERVKDLQLASTHKRDPLPVFQPSL